MNNASNTGFQRTVRACTAAIVAVAFSLAGAGANADHRDGVIRIHIPIHDHGPGTIKLGRLIRHQRHLDLDDYRLRAVVIRNGPFSHGYASLRVDDRRTGRYLLSGRDKVRIDAPGRSSKRWRLRLGPGTRVRAITAVLQPRPRAAAGGRWSGRRHGYGHYDHTVAWRWQHDRMNDARHKHVKRRHDRLEEEVDHRDRTTRDADNRHRERDVRRYADAEAPNRRR